MTFSKDMLTHVLIRERFGKEVKVQCGVVMHNNEKITVVKTVLFGGFVDCGAM